jgi:hypothetical protein
MKMAESGPKHGVFCWNELISRDPKAAERFYSELLGWQAADSGMPGMEYTIFKAGETQAAGLMKMPAEIPAEVPSHWMAYITVADIEAAARKTRDLGGQVMHGPQEIPNLGKFCVIQDPTGAVVSLMEFAK